MVATHAIGKWDLLRGITYSMSYFEKSSELAVTHLWSLSVEEQFYLVWPFVIAVAFPWRKGAACIPLVAAPMLRVALPRFGWDRHGSLLSYRG
jgi:peptidoglycan/LPS O-acetylase OafA/YrhL